MSSVLHPVGPEEPQTYWVRRAIVIGAAIVALIVVIAIVISQSSSGSVVVQGSPSPVAPSPEPTVAATTASSTASAEPTPSAARSSASSTPSATPTSTTAKKSSASPSATSKTEAESKTQAESTTKAKASPSPSPTGKTGPVECTPAKLRATLTGAQKLKTKQSTSFAVSLINGSGETCFVDVNSDNFELKIYSGRDRIWSSNDCAKAVKNVAKKLSSEQALEWKMVWDGRRSKKDCKQRPENPRAGTYFATAQFKGAKPVQLRMVLRG